MKPVPVGPPLPPEEESPQTLIAPLPCRAANAREVEKIDTKPEPLGAPLPPQEGTPQLMMVPFHVRPAKAPEFEYCDPVDAGRALAMDCNTMKESTRAHENHLAICNKPVPESRRIPFFLLSLFHYLSDIHTHGYTCCVRLADVS